MAVTGDGVAVALVLALALTGAVGPVSAGWTGVVTEGAPPARPTLAPPAHRVAPPAVLALAHLAAVLAVPARRASLGNNHVHNEENE